MTTDDRPVRTVFTRRQALAGLTALTSGCAGSLPVGGSTQPVTLAGSLPLSGRWSGIGVPLHRGLRLWAERVNGRGGLQGHEVSLDIVDDRGDTGAAREAYRSFVEEADLLVAPYGSRATGAVIDHIEAAGVPCVAHTAGDRELWASGRSWTVQLLNPIDTFLHGLLEVTRETGAASVGFVYRADSFTPTVMEGAITRARDRGLSVEAVGVYTADGELSGTVASVAAHEPDLLVGAGFQPGAPGGGFLPDALALDRAYATAQGRAGAVCWGIGPTFPAYRERRGDRASLDTGVTGWKPYVDYPGNVGFIDRYRDRWGSPPDTHAAQGHAAGQVFEAAVERAGSVAAGPLRAALFALETATVFGRYRVEERGLQTGKENAVVQWQDGSPVVVWPARWRGGRLRFEG